MWKFLFFVKLLLSESWTTKRIIHHLKDACINNASFICHFEVRNIWLYNHILCLRLKNEKSKSFYFFVKLLLSKSWTTNRIIHHLKDACINNASFICHVEVRNIWLHNQILRLRLRMTNEKVIIISKFIIKWELTINKMIYYSKACLLTYNS